MNIQTTDFYYLNVVLNLNNVNEHAEFHRQIVMYNFEDSKQIENFHIQKRFYFCINILDLNLYSFEPLIRCIKNSYLHSIDQNKQLEK